MFRPRFFLGLLVISILAGAIGADDKEQKKDDSKKEVVDKISKTSHHLTIDGKELGYTAQAGTLVMKDEEGKPKANFFFIAYTLDGVKDKTRRPITFSFNGGPGSSSVWLHLGVLGPRRVFLNEDGAAPAPPYRLIPNEYSLLDKTDLVFIDPVSTGYSRPAPGENPRQFHGVEEDIHSVGEFIRLFTTRYERWSSPKFLIGESYGTTRAAGLSNYLQDRFGMYLNGVMLVSVVLDFQTISFGAGNDLPYVLFLPSYAATAWYHHQLPEELQSQSLEAVLEQAERFALRDYSAALLRGDSMPRAERDRIVRELSRFTGLEPDYIDRAGLRVSMGPFAKELLRRERRTIGRYDSRYVGVDRDATGQSFEYDPSYAAVQGLFTATFYDYVRGELKFESDLPYEILTGKVRPWNFGEYQNRYVDMGESLREAVTKNPYLKVFMAAGFFDLATPFLATKYTIDHLGLSPMLRKNVSLGFYRAGHMMYLHKPSLEKLRDDLAKFIDTAIPGER